LWEPNSGFKGAGQVIGWHFTVDKLLLAFNETVCRFIFSIFTASLLGKKRSERYEVTTYRM
jgi:hypothetical protein